MLLCDIDILMSKGIYMHNGEKSPKKYPFD